MHERDLEAVLAVQAACYPASMQEAAAVLAARLGAAPQTCALACDADGVCAYLFAYPSRLGVVTDLGAPFAMAGEPDTLYLHDLAIAPRASGQGLARLLVGPMLGTAAGQGMAHAALVSVQDSARFWHALGFTATPCAGSLDSYPHDALYMTRTLEAL